MELNFKKKRIAILGLGLEGKDLLNFFYDKAAEITVFDQKEKRELDLTGLETTKINFITGKNYLASGLLNYDIIFRSPGVYRYIPEVLQAEDQGVEISSAIKLFFQLCPAKIIGVTGTKGKGTTATLIYKILKKAKKDTFLAGNIGKPFLRLLPKLKKTSWVVLELSSFQLIDLTQSPNIAVVLNITTDHLDWHKDRSEYIEAKKSIVRYQNPDDYSVINSDYSTSEKFAQLTKAKTFFFSKKNFAQGSFVEDGKIYLNVGPKYEIGKVQDLKLRGQHNWENVAAAICAARLAGVGVSAIKKTVFSFRGLEHRLELVRKVKGVSFYNDSFSTNPQTTIAAINSFTEPITLILGGSDKGLDYDNLAKEIEKRQNVVNIILIGNIANKLSQSLKRFSMGRNVILLGKATMKKIVNKALDVTLKEGVVLLSPATASFDMFENYKCRGGQFKKAVRNLRK